MNYKSIALLGALTLLLSACGSTGRVSTFTSSTVGSCDGAPLVVLVNASDEPTAVLSVDASCSAGNTADPINQACRKKGKFLCWVSAGPGIDEIKAKATSPDGNPFKVVGTQNLCGWNPGLKIYWCALSDTAGNYTYEVTLDNGEKLDPIIILD